jgi:hypothetical protein
VLRVLAGLLVVTALIPLAGLGGGVAQAARDDEVPDPFLTRLLDEINVRRQDAGTRRLRFVPRKANDALADFLKEMLPALDRAGSCGHVSVNGGSSWDYMQAKVGFQAEAHGEVLACPGPEPYWTPDRTADIWWNSSVHREILYADPGVTAVACGTYGVDGKRKGSAAMAVLCVTFHE